MIRYVLFAPDRPKFQRLNTLLIKIVQNKNEYRGGSMKILLILITFCSLDLNGSDKFKADHRNLVRIKRLMKSDDVEILQKNDSETIWAYKVKVPNTQGVGNNIPDTYEQWKFECRSKINIPLGKAPLLSASGCYNIPENMLSANLSDDGALVGVRELSNTGPFLIITKCPKGDTIAQMLNGYSGCVEEREDLVQAYKYLGGNLAKLANFGCKGNESYKKEADPENSALTMTKFAFDKVFICGDKAILDGVAFEEDDWPVYQNLSKVLLALSFTDVALNNAYMDEAANCDELFDYSWRSVSMHERVLLAANLLCEYSMLRDLSSEECKNIDDILMYDFQQKLLGTFYNIDGLYGKGTWGKIKRRYDAINALEGFESSISKMWKLYWCLRKGKLVIKGDEPGPGYMEVFKERILIYDPITGLDEEYLSKKNLLERLKGWFSNTAVAKLVKEVFRIVELYRTKDSEFEDILDFYIQKFSDAKLP